MTDVGHKLLVFVFKWCSGAQIFTISIAYAHFLII